MDRLRERELKIKIFSALRILIIVPFIVGSVGFLLMGKAPLDAMYSALNLYGMDLNEEKINLWVELARWLAPCVLAASVLAIANSLYHFLYVAIVSRKKGSNIIYGRGEAAQLLCGNLKNAVLVENGVCLKGENHIIILENDMESLSFYDRNRKKLESKKTYICLKELSMEEVREQGEILFFSMNDVIARLFWKEEFKVWEQKTQTMVIALLGFGNLGQRLLNYALQLNLFSREQKIVYHVFGVEEEVALLYKNCQLMNQDELVLHVEGTVEQQFKILSEVDAVIITEETDMEGIQKLLTLCREPRIYYYDPFDKKIEQFLAAGDRLQGFGRNRHIFTEKYIKTDVLYKDAKKLNDAYDKVQRKGCQEESSWDDMMSQKAWKELSGFLKASNISEADYQDVLRALLAQDNFDEERVEELAELEHIRWCRFYFLHLWKYGVPKSGAAWDSREKIHRCLLPYPEINESEKVKDRNVIWQLQEGQMKRGE
ncbi:MAG: RyR domain-containing protein [Clostridium sp.]|nr:RyR domain-containing protein [Clostridium sp.]